MKPRRKDLFLVGLFGLALGQVALAMTRRPPEIPEPPPAPRFMALGDTLGRIESVDSAGLRLALVPPQGTGATVVLVYHSQCGHCATVAPVWAEWLSRPREGVRVLAVSREDFGGARDYALQHGWNVEVRSVPAEPGSPSQPLVMRTPWIVVLDAQGVVAYHGHGDGLEAIDDALADLAVGSLAEPGA